MESGRLSQFQVFILGVILKDATNPSKIWSVSLTVSHVKNGQPHPQPEFLMPTIPGRTWQCSARLRPRWFARSAASGRSMVIHHGAWELFQDKAMLEFVEQTDKKNRRFMWFPQLLEKRTTIMSELSFVGRVTIHHTYSYIIPLHSVAYPSSYL